MYECYAHATYKGTPLSAVPWKAASVATKKRKQSEESELSGASHAKQKIAAIDTMEVEGTLPIRVDDSENSDF